MVAEITDDTSLDYYQALSKITVTFTPEEVMETYGQVTVRYKEIFPYRDEFDDMTSAEAYLLHEGFDKLEHCYAKHNIRAYVNYYTTYGERKVCVSFNFVAGTQHG